MSAGSEPGTSVPGEDWPTDERRRSFAHRGRRVALAVVVTLALFRRKRNDPPADPGSPEGDPAAPRSEKRSFFRRSAPSSPTPAPAPTSPPPEYFEGPPEPVPPARARPAGPSASAGPPPDLDALLARLDHLADEIRRKHPGRSRGTSGEPAADEPAKPT